MGPIIAGGLGSVLAVVGAWLAARHQFSGRVTASSAETVWAASEELRAALTGEAGRLRGLVDVHEARIDALQQQVAVLGVEHHQCVTALAAADTRILRLERQAEQQVDDGR